MSSFPPTSWDVRFLQDMENLECGLQSEGGLSMEAFVAIRPAGGKEGSFKFTIDGEMVKLSFPISKVLSDPAFRDMQAEIEMKPGQQIRMNNNSACSTWWDFEDLVSSQDAVVTDGKGNDLGEEFLVAIGHKKEAVSQQTDRPGLCMRWLLGTRQGSKQVLLIAQVSKIRYNISIGLLKWPKIKL